MVHSAATAAAAMEAAAGEVQPLPALVRVTAGGGGGGREPEGLPCPRCASVNTKFCYYNNYNQSQPRHFCRACRRYWTRGGALRNVPVGGGTRKATPAARRKRPPATATATPSPPAPATATPPTPPALHGCSLLRPYGGGLTFAAAPVAALTPSPLAAVDPDPDRRLLDLGGSFTSLIAPAAGHAGGVHFPAAFLVGGLAPPPLLPPRAAPASSVASAALPPPPPPSLPPQQQPTAVSQALPDGVFWSMGWPDLSI